MLLLLKAHNFALLNTREKKNVYLHSPGSDSPQQYIPFSPKGKEVHYLVSSQKIRDRLMLKITHSSKNTTLHYAVGKNRKMELEKKIWKIDPKAQM